MTLLRWKIFDAVFPDTKRKAVKHMDVVCVNGKMYLMNIIWREEGKIYNVSCPAFM